MYRVMYWDNQFPKGEFPKTFGDYYTIQTHSEHKDLNKAKKICRSLGYKNVDNPLFKGYPPVAFVAEFFPDEPEDMQWLLVYNPRFKK